MDFPLTDQKAFFPSIKLKKYRLSKEKADNSVKLMFVQRNIFQNEVNCHEALKQYYSSHKVKQEVASVCVNFKNVEIRNIEDSQKEKKNKLRQISTSINRKKGLEIGIRKKAQTKKKSLNLSQNIANMKTVEEKGILGQMVKMKTDVSEELQTFNEKKLQVFAKATNKKNPIMRQRNSLNHLEERPRLSPWQFTLEEGIIQF